MSRQLHPASLFSAPVNDEARSSFSAPHWGEVSGGAQRRQTKGGLRQ